MIEFPMIRENVSIPGCCNLPDLICRFRKYIDYDQESECWLWKGGNTKGYGVISLGKPSRENILANRLSYLLFVGDLLPKQFACHKCDNSPCVNPSHLFPGTQLDNMRDSAKKGRLLGRRVGFGERQHLARLTTVDVFNIRQREAEGCKISVLSKEYGVTYQCIKNAIDRKTWRHI